MAARTFLLVALTALLCASNGADARQLQQSSTADPSLISAALQYVLSDPSTAASLISTRAHTAACSESPPRAYHNDGMIMLTLLAFMTGVCANQGNLSDMRLRAL